MNTCIDCGKTISNNKVQRCRKCNTTFKYPNNIRDKVIEARKLSPCALQKDIAVNLGISSNRVGQILKESNLNTKHYIVKFYYKCLNCDKPTLNPSGLCSLKCRREYHSIPFYCEQCGKLSHIAQSQLLHRIKKGQHHLYCGKKCSGTKTGNNYGFVAHPENIMYNYHPSKYIKQLPVVKFYLAEGISLHRALIILSIPVGNSVTIKKLLETNECQK
ncbi:hypothetical protein M0R04_08495 [Candidatus Dojkabacteria bacterium]|jgi:hypothetical protein|nr:hypothetical protein [Candidatus Dojkabacteria bacterium]